MLDRFSTLIQSLGDLLGVSLYVDRHHACSIQIKKGLVVQLQSDAAQEQLLIGCKIISLPPGIFRENVLREALKANGKPDPRVGIFAYISQTNHLFLFQRYPFDVLNGERMAGLIAPFFYTCEIWRNAIEKGDAAPQEDAKS